ncbi:MAG: hypothetical protein WBQ79_03020 [Acidobacteriaceae bacterium]
MRLRLGSSFAEKHAQFCGCIDMSEKRFTGFSNNFGAIRVLLAIAVVFSDSFLLGDGVTNADPMKRFNHGEAITGHVAVDLFFIMSGYLITLPDARCFFTALFLASHPARVSGIHSCNGI